MIKTIAIPKQYNRGARTIGKTSAPKVAVPEGPPTEPEDRVEGNLIHGPVSLQLEPALQLALATALYGSVGFPPGMSITIQTGVTSMKLEFDQSGAHGSGIIDGIKREEIFGAFPGGEIAWQSISEGYLSSVVGRDIEDRDAYTMKGSIGGENADMEISVRAMSDSGDIRAFSNNGRLGEGYYMMASSLEERPDGLFLSSHGVYNGKPMRREYNVETAVTPESKTLKISGAGESPLHTQAPISVLLEMPRQREQA